MRVRSCYDTGLKYVGGLGPNSFDIEMPVMVDGGDSTLIQFDIFIGGVVFDSGGLTKKINVPNDLDESGTYFVHFYKTGSGSICHRTKIYQDGVRIAYFQ